jgi:hypothetical protein
MAGKREGGNCIEVSYETRALFWMPVRLMRSRVRAATPAVAGLLGRGDRSMDCSSFTPTPNTPA